MRILVWPDHYWPQIGGIEVLTTRFAEAMRKRGHEIVMVANLPDPGMP